MKSSIAPQRTPTLLFPLALLGVLACSVQEGELDDADELASETGELEPTDGAGSEDANPGLPSLDDPSLQSTPEATADTHVFGVAMQPQPIVSGYRPYLGSIGPIADAEVTEVSVPARLGTLHVYFVKPGFSTTDCGNPSAVVHIVDGQSLTPAQITEVFGSHPVDIGIPNTMNIVTCAGLDSGADLPGFTINVTYETPDEPPPPPPPPPVDSCENACGGVVDLCACDETCVEDGDCCDDFALECPGLCQAYWPGNPNIADQCTNDCPCSAGEGDCDFASHCSGNTYCAQDVGIKYGVAGWVDFCEALPTPTLHVEFVGCDGASPKFLVDWGHSGIAPDSYDVDLKVGFGSYQSFYDGSGGGSQLYWGSSQRNDAFRARVCKNGSCSSFTSRTTGSIYCGGGGGGGGDDGGPINPF